MTKKDHADDLLAEICKNPLDDAPRTVYADVLEAKGDDRGKLIHLQMRRAALPEWDAQAAEIELQERALLADHETKWRTALPKLTGVTWGSFTRGFVGKAAFDSAEAFVKHHDACRAATPLQSIVIRWPRAAKAKKLDAIAGIDEVTVVGTTMRKEDTKWLAGSPLLASVRSLNLIDAELRAGLPDLLKSPHLANLAALRIPLHQLGNAGVTKLTQATLPALTELDLSVGSAEEESYSSYGGGHSRSASTLGNRGALTLASWAGLAKITSLDLSGAKLGREGLTAILASPYSKGLKRLAIRNIPDAEWEVDDSLAAFESGPYGTLDELDISDNDLDNEAATALMLGKALQQLKVLHVERVRSKHFDRLRDASWIHSLRVLSCGESALEVIAKRAPRALHTIRIVAEGSAAREVVKKLTQVPLPALRVLDLSASRISDSSLRVLGNTDMLPNLVAVTLAPGPRASAAFTADGAADFARSPLGQQLKSFHAGFDDLDRAPPQKRIPVGDGEYDGPFRYL